MFYVAGYRGIWITGALDTAYVDRDENAGLGGGHFRSVIRKLSPRLTLFPISSN